MSYRQIFELLNCRWCRKIRNRKKKKEEVVLKIAPGWNKLGAWVKMCPFLVKFAHFLKFAKKVLGNF